MMISSINPSGAGVLTVCIYDGEGILGFTKLENRLAHQNVKIVDSLNSMEVMRTYLIYFQKALLLVNIRVSISSLLCYPRAAAQRDNDLVTLRALASTARQNTSLIQNRTRVLMNMPQAACWR
jgi:hypothetical protein